MSLSLPSSRRARAGLAGLALAAAATPAFALGGDRVPPLPPWGVTATTDAADPFLIHLAWEPGDASGGPIDHYKVTVSSGFGLPVFTGTTTEPKIDARLQTRASSAFVTITAYDAAGNIAEEYSYPTIPGVPTPTPTPTPRPAPIGGLTRTVQGTCTTSSGAAAAGLTLASSLPGTLPANQPLDPDPLSLRLTLPTSVRDGLIARGATDIGGELNLRRGILHGDPNWDASFLHLPIVPTAAGASGSATPFVLTNSGTIPPIALHNQGQIAIVSSSLSSVALSATNAAGEPIGDLGSTSDGDGDPGTLDLPCTGLGSETAYVAVGPVPTPTPPASTPTPPPPPTPTPPPPPTPAPATSLTVSGTARTNTLVRGTVGVSGKLASIATDGTGALTGALQLAPGAARLSALAAIPVTATVSFLPSEDLSGTVASGTFRGSVRETLRLSSVTALGIKLAVGPACQTSAPSTIKLAGPLSAASGGTLAGSFATSGLTGCGALGSVLSTAIQASGNSLVVHLAP